MARKQTAVLTHDGRETGRPYEVTIWFVLDDELYIGTANVNRQWVGNVQKAPLANLSIDGEKFDGTARFLTARAEHERATSAMRRSKYWMFCPMIELGLLTAMGPVGDNTGTFEVALG